MDENEVFLVVACLSVGIGFLTYISRKCLQCKCEKIRCCFGLVDIKRDVITEQKERVNDIEHGVGSASNDNNTTLPTINLR